MTLPRVRLRERVAALVDASRLAPAILRLRARVSSSSLTVLAYHRVRPTPDAGGFDDGVVDATTAEFEEQVKLLRRDFTFVGLDEVRHWTEGGALPRNSVLLTFDDAYRECRDVVLPILLRHGARAAFFVPTQHVEERRMFWWDRAAFVLARATVPRATLASYGGLVLDFSTVAARAATLRRVLRVIKDRFGLDIDSFLDAVADACGVSLGRELDRSLADSLICGWEDILALRRAGMDVQSHTRTHRVLQTLTTREIEDELAGSRAELEAVLREPVSALAYPTGRPLRAHVDIASAVRRTGYRLAFEMVGGTNPRSARSSPFHLRRIPMATGLSLARFQTLLALPGLQ